MRLIDADALKEDLKQYFSDGVLDSISAKIAFSMVLRKIDNAPTVAVNCKDCDGYEAGYSAGLKDSERPQGEWIMDKEHTSNSLLWYKCNKCGIYHSPTNYCPNCGVKMKGGAE